MTGFLLCVSRAALVLIQERAGFELRWVGEVFVKRFSTCLLECFSALEPEISFVCRVADVNLASIVATCEPGAVQQLDKRHAAEAMFMTNITSM